MASLGKKLISFWNPVSILQLGFKSDWTSDQGHLNSSPNHATIKSCVMLDPLSHKVSVHSSIPTSSRIRTEKARWGSNTYWKHKNVPCAYSFRSWSVYFCCPATPLNPYIWSPELFLIINQHRAKAKPDIYLALYTGVGWEWTAVPLQPPQKCYTGQQGK